MPHAASHGQDGRVKPKRTLDGRKIAISTVRPPMFAGVDLLRSDSLVSIERKQQLAEFPDRLERGLMAGLGDTLGCCVVPGGSLTKH